MPVIKKPQMSTVDLYANVDIGNGRNIAFPNASVQNAYFQARVKYRNERCSYIRHTRGVLRLARVPEELDQCNYIAYRNPNYENRVFFAAIVDWEYVNNKTVDIYFVIDYLQTYMFDVHWGSMSIAREHLTEDLYVQSQANPWLPIPSLETSEPLAVGTEYEPIYSNDDEFSLGSTLTDLGQVGVISDRKNTVMLIADTLGFTEDEGQNDAYRTLNRLALSVQVPHDCDGFPVTMAIAYFANNNNKQKWIDYLTARDATDSILGIYELPSQMRLYEKTPDEGYDDAPPPGHYSIDSKVNIDALDPSTGVYKFKISINPGKRRNAKLYRRPFSYIRAQAPDGCTKEFYFEQFKDPLNITLSIMCSMAGTPTSWLQPLHYKTDTIMLNIDERLEFNQYCQSAFTTDGYLTYMAQVMTSSLDNYSVPQQARYQMQANELGTKMYYGAGAEVITKGAAGFADGEWLPGMAAGIVEGISSSMDTAYRGANAAMEGEIRKETLRNMNQILQGNVAYGVYGYNNVAQRWLSDAYQAGGGSGLAQYTQENLMVFRVFIVTLRDDVLDLYDNYFDFYGYSAQKIGIPNVCTYMSGGEQVHFATIDGKKQTYLQTNTAHVYGIPAIAANQICSMFNNGLVLYKGDEM